MSLQQQLLDLQRCEESVVRMVNISSEVTTSLCDEELPPAPEKLRADISEFLRLIREVHTSIEPMIASLRAYEPPSDALYKKQLSDRVSRSRDE